MYTVGGRQIISLLSRCGFKMGEWDVMSCDCVLNAPVSKNKAIMENLTSYGGTRDMGPHNRETK